jgi:vacuolar-type H+-ATPase subunit D/Vma8
MALRIVELERSFGLMAEVLDSLERRVDALSDAQANSAGIPRVFAPPPSIRRHKGPA